MTCRPGPIVFDIDPEPPPAVAVYSKFSWTALDCRLVNVASAVKKEEA
jgi:hypothetical protein